MKINIVQHDTSLKQGYFGLHSDSREFREKSGVNDNRGLGYCGSFTGKSEAAAKVSKPFIDKVLSSGWFDKLTSYSEKHNISTSALIALVLAGIMRPATIMTLPGEKDKEDKIYASGHALSSGIIGFLVSTAITSPFDESIKKVFDKEKFQRGGFKDMAKRQKELKALEEAEKLTDATKKELKALTRRMDARNTIVKNLPDWIIGVPRAILTIALIPPILKYVFGLEKKKKSVQQQVSTNSGMDFIDRAKFLQDENKKSAEPSFKGDPINVVERAVQKTASEESSFFKPFTDAYDKFTDKIADKFTSRFVNWKPITALADKFKDSNNLYQHCLTVGAAVTSGLYVQRTLTNKDMDEDRKKTLAVNQTLTWILSTAGAYTLDKYVKSWWENVTSRFVGLKIGDKDFNKDFKDVKKVIVAVNKELKRNPNADMFKIADDAKKDLNMSERGSKFLEQALEKTVADKGKPRIDLNKFIKKLVKSKEIPALAEDVSKRMKGMGLLRSMIVFGFVYRYFVPVVVTKPANWLCEKYLEHKKSKTQAA